tara:strand:+ start:1139 stop:1345 length:207 start_codon:yes stop_codon:yes gene_type:complete
VRSKTKEIYDKGDLVIIDDNNGFCEIAVILSHQIPMYHGGYEFYQVFSVNKGHIYIVPSNIIKGEIDA